MKARLPLLACAAILGLLGACGDQNKLRCAAAAEGDGAIARAADGHAISRGDRQHRLGEHRQAGGARARLRPGDQVSGRRQGEERHAAVRDRAGALQGQAASRRRRRRKARRPRWSMPKPNSRARRSCRRRTSRPRPTSTRRAPTATPRAPTCCRRRPTSQTAEINLGYTTVSAPFDGVVTARKVSVGELVGGDQPSELATIVQLDPIWVWFNLSERDVQRVRADMAEHGDEPLPSSSARSPVEVGLQTETGYPHKGVLDYAAPTVNQSTGTLQVRGIFENRRSLPCCRAISFACACRCVREQALLVPEVAVGSDQGGRYVLARQRRQRRRAAPGAARPDRSARCASSRAA